MLDLATVTDPEARAFFADARAALTPQPAPTPKPVELPDWWPITPHHQGETLTRTALHAIRGHALRISYVWRDERQAMWVGRWRGGGWSILQGAVGCPASVLTSPHTWDASVRELTKYADPNRAFGGDNFTVDEWLPEFTLICLAHKERCAEHGDGHNFVQQRTLSRYPEGTYRPCGGPGDHDGAYRYRFQVDGRWRQRFGCRRHHAGLIERYLGEADGTITVHLMDDHITH